MTKRFVVVLAALAGLARAVCAGPLEVASVPPGGAVFLDDRYLGVTPLSVEVDATGAHLLRVEKRGYAPWRARADFGGEIVRVEARLAPEALGRLEVRTDPDGADVYVDGRLIGKSPTVAGDLSLASHQVRLVRAGYTAAERDVQLSAREPTAKLELTLSGRIEEYLLAQAKAHPEDITALTDLAHEYALRRQFDPCLQALGKACDAVSTYDATLDQDDLRRVYQEVERLHSKQFEYAPDDVVAALRPKLVAALQAARDRHPENGYNYECLAGLLQAQGDADGALATYEAGAAAAQALPVRIRLVGLAGSALNARGDAAEKAKDWPGALAAYERVVKTYPKSWCALNALARISAIQGDNLGDAGKTVEAARRFLAAFPDSPTGLTVLARAGDCLAKGGPKEKEQAAALYGEAAERYPWHYQAPSVLAKAADLYESQLKDSGKALATWRKLIALSGSSAEAIAARARVANLLRAQGDAKGADALVTEVLRDFPWSAEAANLETDAQKKAGFAAGARHAEAAQAFQKAAALLQAGKSQEAAAAFTAVVAQFGDNYYACVAQDYLVQIWTTAKDWEKVVQAYEQFAQKWPQHPNAPLHLYYAAYFTQTQLNDAPRALVMYRRCADQYPQSYYGEQSLYMVGSLWMGNARVIDYHKAMEAFLRLARDFPHSENAPIARKYIGDCRMQLREPEQARKLFLELMTEDPGSYAAYLAASQGYQWVRVRKDESPPPTPAR